MCLLSGTCSAEELLSTYFRYFWYPSACTQSAGRVCHLQRRRVDEVHGEGEQCQHRKAATKLPSHQEWWSKGTTHAKAEQKP